MDWPDQLDLVPHALIRKIIDTDKSFVSVLVGNGGPSANGEVSEAYRHNLGLAERILSASCGLHDKMPRVSSNPKPEGVKR
jgi:hypothetical protein